MTIQTPSEQESIVRPNNASPNQPQQGQSSGTSAQYYSGPIPPPEVLAGFEKLLPGISGKFLNEPFIESAHRRFLEQKALDAQIKLTNRGQKMAFFIACGLITAALLLMYTGHSIYGLASLVASIAALVTVFWRSKKQHQ